ncbi:hypothetical protein, partial [Marivirga sp.]|uniref:hypothetical protein n=1 Tax=Marivirga sp. TaxID=2018662 RepID=UPI0025DD8F99
MEILFKYSIPESSIINLSSTLICKFRFSYNSIDKASLRRYSGLYRGKITQYIGLYGKAFP